MNLDEFDWSLIRGIGAGVIILVVIWILFS